MTAIAFGIEQKEAAGSFESIANLVTAKNVADWSESLGGPLDMIEEIEGFVTDEPTTWALFAVHDGTTFCYLSNGRGAVATNGYSDWTDSEGLDDLEARWGDYDNLWVN